MRRIVLKTISGALACAMVLCTAPVPAWAAQNKTEVQQEIAELEQQKTNLQYRLATLQANKSDTESYIIQLDAELTGIYEALEQTQAELDVTQENLNRTQENLEQTKADLEVTRQDLADARQQEADQYLALRQRIKQMYESGDTTLMEVFMKAEDLSTILNATEYISKISDYDNQLLFDLEETRATIEEIEARLTRQEGQLEREEAQLAEQKAQLEMLQAQQEEQKAQLEMVMAAKKEELAGLENDIYITYDSISTTEAELENTKQILAAIEEQERREAEERRKREEAERKAREAAAAAAAANAVPAAPVSAAPVQASYSGGFIFPCAGGYISSYYGGRVSPTAGASSNHKGVDVAAATGTAILASAAGTVVTVSYSGARGNYVVISHGSGISTLYQHCSATYVSVGQSVSQGSTIAAVGSTGIATGPHLHYEVLINGVNVDPINYMGR